MKTTIRPSCRSGRSLHRYLWLVSLVCWCQIGWGASPLDTWMLEGPAPATNDLRAITYGNGQYVAVGGGYRDYRPKGPGVILTSPDGVIWTARDPGTANGLYGVAYGSGLFVAVGMNDTIVTSPDGVSWTARNSGTNELHGIAYGNGRFVAVGFNWPGGPGPIIEGVNGIALVSLDGTNWSGSFSRSDALFAVGYASGLFVAGGGVFNAMTIYSTNGITWYGAFPGPVYPTGIVYGEGQFVAVGIGFPANIWSSATGVTWKLVKSGITNNLNSIAFGNGVLVAAGGGSNLFYPVNPTTIVTSQDGITWTQRAPGTTNGLYGITYGNGRFIAVGANGTILRSGEIVSLGPVSVSGVAAQSPITGVAGRNYQIDASANLLDWLSLTNVITDTNGTASFNDPSATNFGGRFYRAVGR